VEGSSLRAAERQRATLFHRLDPRLADVRWMLEELRVSLFAQHLGAAGPISVQRIRKALSA
ncbi:MAG: DUF3418 domain-containing protein, partial [Rhodoglobus sp.]